MQNDKPQVGDEMHEGGGDPAILRDKAASPSVLRRRKFHIAINEWEAKTAPWLQTAGALIGFVFVLLPVMSKGWRAVIQDIGPTRWFFEEFSRLGPIAMAIFFMVMTNTVILNALARHFPGDWNAKKEWGFPTSKQILDRQLFPTTFREEIAFMSWVLSGFCVPFIYIMGFGVFSFFMRIGER